MGDSEREMKLRTILGFGMIILNLKESFGIGRKREENPFLFDIKL